MQFDREIIDTFLLELEECLLLAEDSVIALESRPDDGELPHVILRTIHTVKGAAGAIGFSRLAAVAHALEDLLEGLCRGTLVAETAIITLVLDSIDWLRTSGEEVRVTGADTSFPSQALLERLGRASTHAQQVTLAGAGAAERSPAERSPAALALRRSRTLRVHIDNLDAALDMAGEITAALERLPALHSAARQELPADVVDVHQSLLRLSRELQDRVIALRLVPIGPTLRGFIRTVRDVSTMLDKNARLIVEGGEVTVDANVIELLREPLLHLIRNALDHGLEPSRLRKSCGKDPCGRITVRAQRDAGTFVVQVEDDGAGLSRQRIAARARALGLLQPGRDPTEDRSLGEAADKLSDAELFALVFVPGFSTAEHVTDLSGRGVGMDVVKRVVESMHGKVGIASQEGVGTTVTIRLPVSSALMDGFAVGLDEDVFLLPREAVREVLGLPAGEREGPAGVLQLHGRPLPFVRLHALLSCPRPPPSQESLVVLDFDGQQLGLAVEQLHGEKRAVVKPMSPAFRSVRVFSGCTVLGSGRIGLVLDIAGLFQEALRFRAARPMTAAAAGERA